VHLVGLRTVWSNILQRMVQISRLERSENNSKIPEGAFAVDTNSCTYQCGPNCGLPRRSRAKFFCFGFEPSQVFDCIAVQLLHWQLRRRRRKPSLLITCSFSALKLERLCLSACLSDSHGTVSHAVETKLISSQCILTVTQTFSLNKLSKCKAHKFRIVFGI